MNGDRHRAQTQTAQGADERIRLLAGVALAALAGITATVSNLHALAVVRGTGSTGLVAYLIPFVADLMIVTAPLALLEAARNGGTKPKLAIGSLLAGIGSTVAMNVVAGLAHGTGARAGREPAARGPGAVPGNSHGPGPASACRRRTRPPLGHCRPLPAPGGQIGRRGGADRVPAWP